MTNGRVRIVFKLEKDEDDYPPVDYERLWARPRGDGSFEVDNIPFFVRDISAGDVVAAQEVEGEWMFSGLIQASSSSTLRVIVFDEAQVQAVRERLGGLECSTELNGPRLVSVDVPAEVDLQVVRNWLLEQEQSGALEFEDACIRHVCRRQQGTEEF